MSRENNHLEKRSSGMEAKCVLSGYAIAVVDRGFVYVGKVDVDKDWCVITDAQNIRYWGTKAGLGELALNGPRKETRLDSCGTVRVPKHALVTIIDTEAGKWNN